MFPNVPRSPSLLLARQASPPSFWFCSSKTFSVHVHSRLPWAPRIPSGSTGLRSPRSLFLRWGCRRGWPRSQKGRLKLGGTKRVVHAVHPGSRGPTVTAPAAGAGPCEAHIEAGRHEHRPGHLCTSPASATGSSHSDVCGLLDPTNRNRLRSKGRQTEAVLLRCVPEPRTVADGQRLNA